MSSKMVSNLQKLGVRVTATTGDRSRNDEAMQGLIRRCADVVPEGTTSLTLEEAQLYIGQQIAFETEALRRFDDDHIDRLVEVDGERTERNRWLTEVYDGILQTRRAFEIVHGPGSGKLLLGLDTTVPDDPERLYSMADRCRRWLRDPARVFPEPVLPAFQFDREQSAAGLDGPVDALGQALKTLPAELKRSIDTLASKFEAMRRLDKLIGQGARFTEALYDLAGMEFQSQRVRPTSHRSASSRTPAAPPAGEDTSPAATGAAPEAPAPDAPSEGPQASPADPAADGRPAAGSPADGQSDTQPADPQPADVQPAQAQPA